VGFEARGHGGDATTERPATVLNAVMNITRAAGRIGIPGLYVTGDPGAADDAAKEGSLSIRTAWAGPSRTSSRPANAPSCGTTGS
jgi:glutathione-independent formaldehyde dehydrogenase